MSLKTDFIKIKGSDPKILDDSGKPQFNPKYVFWLEDLLRKHKKENSWKDVNDELPELI